MPRISRLTDAEAFDIQSRSCSEIVGNLGVMVDTPMPETAERAQLPLPKSAGAIPKEEEVTVHHLMVHFNTVQVMDTRQDLMKLMAPYLSLGRCGLEVEEGRVL